MKCDVALHLLHNYCDAFLQLCIVNYKQSVQELCSRIYGLHVCSFLYNYVIWCSIENSVLELDSLPFISVNGLCASWDEDKKFDNSTLKDISFTVNQVSQEHMIKQAVVKNFLEIVASSWIVCIITAWELSIPVLYGIITHSLGQQIQEFLVHCTINETKYIFVTHKVIVFYIGAAPVSSCWFSWSRKGMRVFSITNKIYWTAIF